jgi:hypothetical protein
LNTVAWPHDDLASLRSFYGEIHLGRDGMPSPEWESSALVTFPAPFPMVASWDTAIPIRKIRCHRLVQPSLQRIMNNLWKSYLTAEERETAGLNMFGGVYAFRRIAGAARLSCHAFGAAIDIDPGRNPLGKPWEFGMMPLGVVAVFEAEGWEWGGRWTHRPDCQHFQAARTTE